MTEDRKNTQVDKEPRTLDHLPKGKKGRIIKIVALEKRDPYPTMAARLGLATDMVLLANGYDNQRGVFLFEEVSSDRRFGLPINTCKRVQIKVQ